MLQFTWLHSIIENAELIFQRNDKRFSVAKDDMMINLNMQLN